MYKSGSKSHLASAGLIFSRMTEPASRPKLFRRAQHLVTRGVGRARRLFQLGGASENGGTPVNHQVRSAADIAGDVAYAIQVARNYLDQLRRLGLELQGLRFLELGPGINFGPQLILASQGVHVTLADRFLAPWAGEYHPAFYATLLDAWPEPNSALAQVVRDGGYGDRLRLVEAPAEALGMLADGSVDVTMSNAVLEHVYDVEAVAAEIARVTRPGGLGSHQIDLRDHSDFDRPLEFLLVAEGDFARELEEKHGERGNRHRLHEVMAMFRAAGFEVEADINMRAEADYLADVLPRLRTGGGRFGAMTKAELSPIAALLTLRKPEA